MSDDLKALLEKSRQWWANATKAERAAMVQAQRESWVRSCEGGRETSVMMRPSPPAVQPAPEVAAEGELRGREVANWLASQEDIPGLPDCYQPRAVAVALYRAVAALAAFEAGK